MKENIIGLLCLFACSWFAQADLTLPGAPEGFDKEKEGIARGKIETPSAPTTPSIKVILLI